MGDPPSWLALEGGGGGGGRGEGRREEGRERDIQLMALQETTHPSLREVLQYSQYTLREEGEKATSHTGS